MSTAVFRATGLFLWSRNRMNLLICAVGYGTAFIGSQIPDLSRSALFQSMAFGYLLFTPLVFPLIMFIGSSLGPNGDLTSPESPFPRQFYVLPVAVRPLVLAFMSYAMLFCAAQWSAAELISDGRVLAFLGGRLWIPLLATSVIAWMQALLWTPVRRRLARLLQLLVLMSCYVSVFVLSLRAVLPVELTIVLSIAQFPIAYAVAVRGVARSRRGEPGPFVADQRHTAPAPSNRRHGVPRLRGPFAAQLWMERKIHPWAGKSFLIALLPAALTAVMFAAILSGARGTGVQTLGSAAIYLLFGSVVLIGISTGLNFGSFRAYVPWNQPAAAHLMPVYLATLPFSSGDFAWAKIRSAMGRMLWVCAGTVLLSALIAGVSGYAHSWMAQHTAWRAEYGLAVTLGLAAVPPLASVMLALSATTGIMWIVLLGRSKEFTIAVLSVCWLCLLASSRFSDRQIIAFQSVFVPWAAGVKVCVLVALVLHVGSRRVLSWSRLTAVVGFWALTAGTLTAWLWWYAPHSLFTPMRSVWTGLLVAPVLGTVAAPLALARNRAR